MNVVATGNLMQHINLVKVSQLEHVTHDQEIYGGRVAYLKTPKMHGKVTIFSSGKLISIGTKSPKQAREDLVRTYKILNKKGLIKKIEIEAEVRNIVAVLQTGNSVDLEEFSMFVNGVYEPEQFPGMMIRNESPKATYLVFSSGKIVIVGSKSINDLKKAAKIIENLLHTKT